VPCQGIVSTPGPKSEGDIVEQEPPEMANVIVQIRQCLDLLYVRIISDIDELCSMSRTLQRTA